MRIGILGCGSIASVMAKTVSEMDEIQCYGVASRSFEKAEAFREAHGFEKAFGSYEELVQDELVDFIYIATPHSHHYENMMMCLEHNKAVLCEKAFTMNAKQAREVLALSKEKNVLVTEAIWTRYMPSRTILNELVSSGIIGEVSTVSANLCYPIHHVPRLTDPNLAGGSLLDVGIYPLNFASMILGHDVLSVHAHATLTDTGVDRTTTMTLVYPENKVAMLFCGMDSISDRIGSISGNEGYINVTNINNISKIEVFNSDSQCIKSIEIEHEINGYEYQVQAVVRALENNQYECEEMPHEHTLYMMTLMDEIRHQIGVKYPGE